MNRLRSSIVTIPISNLPRHCILLIPDCFPQRDQSRYRMGESVQSQPATRPPQRPRFSKRLPVHLDQPAGSGFRRTPAELLAEPDTGRLERNGPVHDQRQHRRRPQQWLVHLRNDRVHDRRQAPAPGAGIRGQLNIGSGGAMSVFIPTPMTFFEKIITARKSEHERAFCRIPHKLGREFETRDIHGQERTFCRKLSKRRGRSTVPVSLRRVLRARPCHRRKME